jgi:hypothetical protein
MSLDCSTVEAKSEAVTAIRENTPTTDTICTKPSTFLNTAQVVIGTNIENIISNMIGIFIGINHLKF